MEVMDMNKNLIELIDDVVQWLAQQRWPKDNCPPKFWVSLNNEEDHNQSILLTISHNGLKFTETLFPRKKMLYGYPRILDHIIELYNRTM